VLVPSTEADHVIPISQGGARFDAGNGQGLCKACHSAKTLQQQRMNSAVVS
jgi:5-methylcytosine-specific restriction endonuclease McrA